jgi:hypothetical protein
MSNADDDITKIIIKKIGTRGGGGSMTVQVSETLHNLHDTASLDAFEAKLRIEQEKLMTEEGAGGGGGAAGPAIDMLTMHHKVPVINKDTLEYGSMIPTDKITIDAINECQRAHQSQGWNIHACKIDWDVAAAIRLVITPPKNRPGKWPICRILWIPLGVKE